MRYDDLLVWDPSGQDQELIFVPDGTRVASADWWLEDPDYASGSAERYVASGTVAVDSVSTGLTFPAGASQAYPGRVFVDDAATSLTASQTVEIVHSGSGATEDLEILALDGWDAVSGSYVTARFPLQERTIPSGSTLRGKGLTIPIPGSVVSNETLFDRQEAFRLFLRWRAGSRTRTAQRLIRFERNESSGFDIPRIEKAFRGMFPGANHSRLSAESLRELIRQSVAECEADLRRYGREPGELLLGPNGDRLILWKMCDLYAMDPFKASDERLTDFGRVANSRYFKMLESLSNGQTAKGMKEISRVDATDKQASNRNPFVSIWDRGGV